MPVFGLHRGATPILCCVDLKVAHFRLSLLRLLDSRLSPAGVSLTYFEQHYLNNHCVGMRDLLAGRTLKICPHYDF